MKYIETRIIEFATNEAADYYMEKLKEAAKEAKAEAKAFKSLQSSNRPFVVESIIVEDRL